jgi:hypothetical protein
MARENLGPRPLVLAFVTALAVANAAVPASAKNPLPVRAREVLALRAGANAVGQSAATTATANGIGGIDTWVTGRPLYCLTITSDAGERGLYIELKGGTVSAVSTDPATMALFASACSAKETELGLHFSDQTAGTVDSVYLAVHPIEGGGNSDDDEDDSSVASRGTKQSR